MYEPGKGMFDRDLQQAGASYLRAKARREDASTFKEYFYIAVFAIGTIILTVAGLALVVFVRHAFNLYGI